MIFSADRTMSAVRVDIQCGSTCITCVPVLTLLDGRCSAAAANGSPYLSSGATSRTVNSSVNDASVTIRHPIGVRLLALKSCGVCNVPCLFRSFVSTAAKYVSGFAVFTLQITGTPQ